MMKNYKLLVSVIFFLVFTQVYSQKKEILKILITTNSFKEIKDVVNKYDNWSLEVIKLNSNIDTTELDKILLSKKPNSIAEIEDNIYKVIKTDTSYNYRVSYIFLNGDKLPIQLIDSLRNLIKEKYNSGVSFAELAEQYSMDGNARRGGDIGWFSPEMMDNKFVAEVLKHKINDVYMVDIPNHNWYYIVKNTDEPKLCKTNTILKIINNN